MKKLAFSAMALGALAMVAMVGTLGCGGGGGNSVKLPSDAGSGDGGVVAACDPYKQTGCSANQKCAEKIDQLPTDAGGSELSAVACVPNGTVSEGGACTIGSVSGGMGYDNCKAGLACVNKTCQKVCDSTVSTSCPMTATCLGFSDLFSEFKNYGVCQPACDPVTQDCPNATDACYMLLNSGKGVCGAPEMGAENSTQNDPCYMYMGQIYLNSCARGYGCDLPKTPSDMNIDTCGFYCNPGTTTDSAGQHIGCSATFPHPDAGVPTDGGSDGGVTDGGSGAPIHPNGPGSNYECRYLNSFYQGANMVPNSVGICVNTNVWGKCSDTNNKTPVGCKPYGAMRLPKGLMKMPAALEQELKHKGYMK